MEGGDLDNIASAELSGPFAFVKAAGPARLPMADRALTFATNSDRDLFPPAMTVYDIFRRWVKTGMWQRVNDALRDQARIRAGRSACPAAAIIDSQSVRGADTVPTASRRAAELVKIMPRMARNGRSHI